MTITFPRGDIFTVGKFNTQSFNLKHRSELSRHASGWSRPKDLGYPLWVGSWGTVERKNDFAIELEAIIRSMDDGIHGFLAGDLRRQYPKAYPTGAFTDSGQLDAATTGSQAKIKSLPAGFVITRGDYFCFDYTIGSVTYRAYHQAMESVTASGAGLTALFDVRPYIISGWAASAPVTFKKPTACFKLDPGSFDPEAVSVITSSGKFSAYQSLRLE